MTQTLLQVRDLSKRFKEREVVKGISFNITESSCAALLGPNGAGKTTRSICWLDYSNRQEVRLSCW